jgi:hypothetical protein
MRAILTPSAGRSETQKVQRILSGFFRYSVVPGHGDTVFQLAYDSSNFCIHCGIASRRVLLSGWRRQWRLNCTIEGELFCARFRELAAEITETSFVEQIHAVTAIIRLIRIALK